MKPNPRLLLLALAGGAAGSFVRFGISLFTAQAVALLIVNLAGAALLGWFNAISQKPDSKLSSDSAKALWSVGFAGGFTTVSGLAMFFVSDILTTGGASIVVSFLYVVIQLILGIAAYLGAFALTHKKAVTA